MKKISGLALGLLMGVGILSAGVVNAACSDVTRAQLQTATDTVRDAANTGGLNLDMWVTMVDETGAVCHVVTSGVTGAAAGNTEWLGSRVISAQKANTANAFSLDGLSISTGALFAAVQPGGSLFGLQESNPVNAAVAYAGSPRNYGTNSDPLKGKRLGGVNVFGGGIALYKAGKKVGAIGVSGDTSCTDHAFAWKVRETLGLAFAGAGDVEKLLLKTDGEFTALGQHPACIGTAVTQTAAFGFTAP